MPIWKQHTNQAKMETYCEIWEERSQRLELGKMKANWDEVMKRHQKMKLKENPSYIFCYISYGTFSSHTHCFKTVKTSIVFFIETTLRDCWVLLPLPPQDWNENLWSFACAYSFTLNHPSILPCFGFLGIFPFLLRKWVLIGKINFNLISIIYYCYNIICCS